VSRTCVPASFRAIRRLATAASLLVCAAVSLCFGAAPARANGDPASDVLLAQDVFYPYQPKIGANLEAAMNTALHRAGTVGLHLKVAIIATPEELGIVPKLFGHPQAYAEFLDREIRFNGPQSLLVVMPAGFGVVSAGPPAALAGLSVDARQRSYGLTRSAILAVIALARATGHPVAAPAIPPASSGGGGTPALLVFGVPVAVLILGGLIAARRGRARRVRDRGER
jgi:hypothetical protein